MRLKKLQHDPSEGYFNDENGEYYEIQSDELNGKIIVFIPGVNKYQEGYYLFQGADENEWSFENAFDIKEASKKGNAEEITQFLGIGEGGKGVAFVTKDTVLQTSGLISCVGWLLYNDDAAYLAHILVVGMRPDEVSPVGIKEQVMHLHNCFCQNTGSAPTDVLICLDQGNAIYQKRHQELEWLTLLVPGQCRSKTILVPGEISHVVHPSARKDSPKRVEWTGKAITLQKLK